MNTLRILLLLSAGLLPLLAACAPANLQSPPHLIVDKEGFPLSDEGERLSETQFDERIEKIRQRVGRHIREHAGPERPARLLVMIHGGLTDIDEGLTYIDSMTDDSDLLEKSGELQADVLPIFINWDSSLRSSLWDDLFLVRLGKRNPVTGILTSPFLIAARLADGVIWFPVNLVHHLDTVSMQFQNWKMEERSAEEYLGNGALTIVSLPPSLAALPFVSGYGKGAWLMMRRRIDQMFAHQIQPLPPFYADKVERPGALRKFFEVIEAEYGIDPEEPQDSHRPKVEVTLVGHSMGAIVANRILRDFPNLQFDRIVYMAAAASIDDFITTVPPYLSRYPDSRFYSFSLANHDETGEFNYFAPQGSLLVWIDNFLEPGFSATGKRVGFFVNRDAIGIRRQEDSVCERIHFLKFAGHEGDPGRHGEFNDPDKFQRVLEIALADFAGQRPQLEQRFEIHDEVCLQGDAD